MPREGDFYLCGPTTFLNDLRTGLTAWGVASSRIHSEIFSGGPSLMPGVVAAKDATDKPTYRIGTAGGFEVPMEDLVDKKLNAAE